MFALSAVRRWTRDIPQQALDIRVSLYSLKGTVVVIYSMLMEFIDHEKQFLMEDEIMSIQKFKF